MLLSFEAKIRKAPRPSWCKSILALLANLDRVLCPVRITVANWSAFQAGEDTAEVIFCGPHEILEIGTQSQIPDGN